MKTTIDRHALVTRHNPVIRRVEPLSPQSVGNGEFAFTADITGLQSFPEAYVFPIGTQSQWGWHSSGSRDKHALEELRLKPYETYGRTVGYATDGSGQEEAFHWLRQNPHRLQLGLIGLTMWSESGERVRIEDLQAAEQTLDLWSGVLRSSFKVDGIPVMVSTCCHPYKDQLSVRIESPLVALGRLFVSFRFPAPAPQSRAWDRSTDLNWEEEQTHTTEVAEVSNHGALFIRTMDEDGYQVNVAWSEGELRREGVHAFLLAPKGEHEHLELTAAYALPQEQPLCGTFEDVSQAAQQHWASFWSNGGAIDFTGSTDPRAFELERRVVLSQYLTAIHCSGTLPPQETGLLYNSWFGKFHLEMHWWHAAHFAQWGRAELLKKSLDWYSRILPEALELARSQGYEGARWPKMVGPEGRQSPSNVGTLLIWQQPHPIDLAELCYQAEPTRDTLLRFRDIVMESARFMADYAVWDTEHGRYVLGPPLIPAQENHRGEESVNPTFELEYWRHALDIALKWRERLGLPTEEKWRHVRDCIAQPTIAEGVYLAHERCPDSYTEKNIDHPSMLGALGILPGGLIDREVMRSTLKRVIRDWQWDTSWGWDFPMAAMTAARLGERKLAVDLLLMKAVKNTYLPNGHNYQREGLYAYLPGNGGLLAAVALMAAGWQKGPLSDAPGFPDDGTWTVRCEGLQQRL